uniref:Solute carrier family 13 member 5-like n=1 Tax=Phallusia mammillata TaxID=59560 RepID=A0A6F9DSK7_9ASCI|nr:solute carrier family 13 member 5-like [Phallusia mammillata]
MEKGRFLQIPSFSALVLVLTPILLSPLPVIVPGKESDCAFVILWVALYWITGCLPLGVTSLLPVIVFTFMEILTLTEVTNAFFFNGIWLLLGSISLAIAAQTAQLHLRISLKILLLIGTSPKRLLFGFMLVTYFLSMVISNVVITAMMIPIVEGVIEEMKQQEKYGKNKNLHECMVLEEKHSNQSNAEIEHLPEDTHMDTEMRNLAKGLTMCIPYASSIGGVASLTGTWVNIIVVTVLKASFPRSEEIGFATWFFYCFPASLITFVVAYFWLMWLYFGISHPRMWFKRRDKSIDATKILLEGEYVKLGPIRWKEKWVLAVFCVTLFLWFTRRPGFMPGWSQLIDGKYVNDGVVALTTVFILFLIPQEKPTIFTSKTYRKQQRKRSKSILSWFDIQKYFIWELIFIVGAGLTLAEGAKKSGLSTYLANQLSFLVNYPPWLACLCLSLFGMAITECTSNTAVTNIMLPILVKVAVAMRVHPYYICLPTVLSVSLAFMLPVATPANAVAYSSGHFKIVDMLKAGWFLNLVGVLFITLSINTYGVVFFNLNQYPDWANIQNQTNVLPGNAKRKIFFLILKIVTEFCSQCGCTGKQH